MLEGVRRTWPKGWKGMAGGRETSVAGWGETDVARGGEDVSGEGGTDLSRGYMVGVSASKLVTQQH